MPFREKAKSLLRGGRHRKTSDGDSLSKTSTKNSGSNHSSGGDGSPTRWPSHVYKPGEPMPRPKYRATPAKAHTERLNAFSFADAWRSKSFQSQYSPMGTRAPSRRNSTTAGGASSRLHSRRNSVFSLGGVGRRSSVAANSDGPLTESVTSTETIDAKDFGSVGAAKPPRLSTEVERESEEDEEEEEKDRQLAGSIGQRPKVGVPRQMSTARDHQPFTEQDLSMALHRSHLAVPTRS